MQLEKRINALATLGDFMKVLSSNKSTPNIFEIAQQHNGWFTQSNIQFAFSTWGEILTRPNLEKWVQPYSIMENGPKNVAIVMAGNIPLVGFHDFISVLITGHHAQIKLSSNDNILLPFIVNELLSIESEFESYISFSNERLEHFDAVIATGSNNTSLYFEHYFGKYPNIIRKNRNSAAILSGDETTEDLEKLADDIFMYFGLGCRNVSKLYLPDGYDFSNFFKAMYRWRDIINNQKYINNYDYNKAVYLMSNIDLLDNEFMLLKEDKGFASPISVVFYEYYKNRIDLEQLLNQNQEATQCIVSNDNNFETISFGTTQMPKLWDYADGVDTLDFLTNL